MDGFVATSHVDWEEEANFSTILHQLERLGERLKDLGIPVPPNSRLETYNRVLAAAVDPNRHSKVPTLPFLARTLLETREMCTIVEAFSKKPITGFRERMRIVLGGNVLASADNQNSQARDTQFELYLAAVAMTSGICVELTEPDLLLTMDGITFSIAAKRLKSEKLIKSNIRKAADQICRCGCPGLVALDISFIEQISKPIFVDTMSAASSLATVLADGFAHEYMPRIQSGRWIASDQVLGICFCVRAHCFLIPDHTPTSALRWTLVDLDRSSANAHVDLVKFANIVGSTKF